MRFLCLVTVLMTGMLSSVPLRAQDAAAPEFRIDTNMLSFEFDATASKGLRGKAAPLTTLTVDDMKVVIDRKEFTPTAVAQDVPGHYVLTLAIPDAYRDGKTHKVRFKVKKVTFPFTHTFTLPKTPDAGPGATK